MRKQKVHYRNLATWLNETDQSARDAAKSFGVSAAYLYYILDGKRKPGRNLISKMARVGIDPMSFL